MEETTKLIIEVASEHAQEILNKGDIEVALRDLKKRFSALYKCTVSEAPVDKSEAMQKAMEKAMSKIAQKTSSAVDSIENVRKVVNTVEKNTELISNSVKNVAANVDKLAKMTKLTQGLGFLNVGMSMANMAVDVAGFAMVSKKLSEISDQIKEIDAAIKKQAEEKKIDKLLDGRELIMAYNDLSDAWKSDEKVSLDKEQNLLRQMTTYLSGITEYMIQGLLDIELCMDIIMSMLPAYTILITEYIKQYYFERKSLPTNLDSYKDVYKEFLNPELRTMLIDYFFIEKGIGYNEAMDDTNMVTLLALNDLTTIEDQAELLKMAETEEDYKEVDRELERLAQMQLDQMLGEVS